MLADVLAQLDRDGGIDDAVRKKYTAAIRTTCSMLSRTPDVVPGDLSQVLQLLKEIPAAVHGRASKTIANMRSTLKAALVHGLDTPKMPPRGTPLEPGWAKLKDALPDRRLRHGLSRLIGLASYQGVNPEDMSDLAFQRMVDVVRSVNWGRRVLPFERDVPRLWNEARARVPEWPPVRLTERAASNRPSHLPLSAFPQTFQEDVEAYLAWAAGGDPFAPDAPTKPLKSSTLRLRREQLRIAASTLARQLGDASVVRDLALLAQPENVKKILRPFHKDGSDPPFSEFARGLYITLHAVAKTWVKASPSLLAELSQLKRVLKSDVAGLTKKNRTMLRQFDDPRVLANLLALPDLLRKVALTRRMSVSRRLQQMRIALAIDILLVAPVRLQNLAGLRLDRQLQWPNGRSGTVYIVLEVDETKNEQALEYPLPDRIRDHLLNYIDRYRLPGKTGDNSWLFVDNGGKPVPSGTLRDGITKAIKRGLGVDITPHQFRHLAAKIALDAQPGAIGLVQSLLGHKNLKTTQKSYAGMRTREAARFYDQLLNARIDTLPAAR